MTDYKTTLMRRLYAAGKLNLLNIVDETLAEPDKLTILIEICLSDEERISYHAGWALMYLCQKDKNVLTDVIDLFIDKLKKTSTDSQLASILKILYHTSYDTRKLLPYLDFLEDLIFTEKKQLFIRHYSMNLLLKIAKEIPGTRQEAIEVFKLAYEVFIVEHMKKKAANFANIVKKLV